jgi:NAD(P)-dependent dehydrogenase (short-subunit alcohol dehydrogenase family)
MAKINSKLAITGKPVWFITGCSTGIGRELAKHVLSNNAGICYFSSVEESEEDQMRAISGRQPGDPVRAAHVIVKATESLNPQHRLLLGNDAYEVATKKLEELRKEFSALESVSRMADFPKNMQGQTAWTASMSRR